MIVTTVIIVKYMALTPVLAIKVATKGKDVVVDKVVMGTEKEGAKGGTASQPSLASTLVLITPRPTIMTPSIAI